MISQFLYIGAAPNESIIGYFAALPAQAESKHYCPGHCEDMGVDQGLVEPDKDLS